MSMVERPKQTVEELAKLCQCDVALSRGIGMICMHCTGPIGMEQAARIIAYREERDRGDAALGKEE